MALVHHELCFGCGRTNLFGLLLEAERQPDASVRGRCFIKQDHQGPTRGQAHEGIIATALCEAMSHACGPESRPRGMSVEYVEAQAQAQAEADAVPVGSFLEVEATVLQRSGAEVTVEASARLGEVLIARARGTYVHRVG